MAENAVGLQTSAFSGPIRVDDTPPSKGTIVELSSFSLIDPNNENSTVEYTRRACQNEKGKRIFWKNFDKKAVDSFIS